VCGLVGSPARWNPMQEAHRQGHNSNAGRLAYFSSWRPKALFLNGDQNEEKKRDPRLLEEEEGASAALGD